MKKILFALIFIITMLLGFSFLSSAGNMPKYCTQYSAENGKSYELTFYVSENMKEAFLVDWDDKCEKLIVPESITYKSESGEEMTLSVVSVKNAFTKTVKTKYLYLPETVKTIEKSSIGYEIRDGEKTIIKNFTIGCVEKSTAHNFAKKRKFLCEVYLSLQKAKISLLNNSFVYNSKRQKPSVSVAINDIVLKKNTDYTISYQDNLHAGNAYVIVTGIGQYRGSISKKFKITPQAVQNPKISIKECLYTGKKATPNVTVALGEKKLKQTTHFTVKSSDIYPGKAEVTITFTGDYKGKFKSPFNIVLTSPQNLTASPTSNGGMVLKWGIIDGCVPDKYYIYRKASDEKNYTLISKQNSSSLYYTDNSCVPITKYSYQVCSVAKKIGKTFQSSFVSVSHKTELGKPDLTVSAKTGYNLLKWTKINKADGYYIYRVSKWNGRFDPASVSLIYTADKNTFSYNDKNIYNTTQYLYIIRSYIINNKKTYKSDGGGYCSTSDTNSILKSASLHSKNYFYIYNTQDKTTTKTTYTLSQNEIEILKNFKEAHFTANMTREGKLRYTLDWINRNVTYAYGSSFSSVSSSFVEAVFVQKMGQCAQYNGAMVAMMTYLGYDSSLILGYRGTYKTGNYWQHYWGEITISGSVYLMETGNYGSSGSWTYFLTPYKDSSGYIKNKKNLGN